MEYVILKCFASNVVTSHSLVLKGGNALRFGFQSPRSTKDLDFSIMANGIPDNADQLRSILDNALRFAERRFNVKARCQRVNRNPNRPDATWPTYDIGVGYQFPTDAYFHSFDGRNVSTVIPVEISFNDRVCETSPLIGVDPLRTTSLEDILAEKLRSLLQQKPRKRNRHQDVYDVAMQARRKTLDRSKISSFLLDKSQSRGIVVRKTAFDSEIRRMAAEDYEKRIHEQAPHDFIQFDEAWNDVMALVQSLDIPD